MLAACRIVEPRNTAQKRGWGSARISYRVTPMVAIRHDWRHWPAFTDLPGRVLGSCASGFVQESFGRILFSFVNARLSVLCKHLMRKSWSSNERCLLQQALMS
jgi:hypothetical protein